MIDDTTIYDPVLHNPSINYPNMFSLEYKVAFKLTEINYIELK